MLNKSDWNKKKASATLVKTSKLFRPYGTTYHLPIIGRAYVAAINKRVYIVISLKDLSLLGEADTVRLGIVTINLKGASEEVDVKNVEFLAKSELPRQEPVQSDQFQRQI